jgi:mono/diheme cytochrome c family protein
MLPMNARAMQAPYIDEPEMYPERRSMRNIGLFLLAALAGCSSGPRLPRSPQGAPVVEIRGAVKGAPFALAQADLERLPRLEVRGREPHAGAAARWEGTSVAAMVSERVDVRKGADTAIVRTADRAAIPVPLTVIRQLKPVLADRADGARLGTRILAWPTEQQQGLASDPRAASWWARDVVAFEVVEWQRTFGPALAPPDGAADAARRGAGVYGESCIACHRMRGVGGERGPDLTTIAARLRPGAFASLLADHPGWTERPPGETSSDAAASELWSFLKIVALSATGAAPERPVTADVGEPVANSP